MKLILLFATISLFNVAIFAQNEKQVPPSWGHYKKLETLSPTAIKGMEPFDTLRFVLATGETKVEHIERSVSGPNASGNGKKKAIPESTCDPAACQPADLVGNGRKREPFYLTTMEKFSIADPPANSSPQTRAELDYLLQLQSQRSGEDERASAFYAGVYYKTAAKPDDKDYVKFRRNLFHIGRSIGTWFNPDSLPLTAELVARTWKDAEYYIWKYKNYFLRIRPYKLETKLNNLEETNWAAYPSGHATNSYVNAYLFSALLPEFSSFFIKDAYDMAHSREIIGVHYPSDSESGRLLAYQLVQRLLANKNFKKDFEAARAEIQRVKATKGY
ncbi:MAG: phosphatase PAP2 family protein [Chitinophagaceae bacterium]